MEVSVIFMSLSCGINRSTTVSHDSAIFEGNAAEGAIGCNGASIPIARQAVRPVSGRGQVTASEGGGSFYGEGAEER